MRILKMNQLSNQHLMEKNDSSTIQKDVNFELICMGFGLVMGMGIGASLVASI